MLNTDSFKKRTQASTFENSKVRNTLLILVLKILMLM